MAVSWFQALSLSGDGGAHVRRIAAETGGQCLDNVRMVEPTREVGMRADESGTRAHATRASTPSYGGLKTRDRR